MNHIFSLIKVNYKSAIAVALVSIPLSISLAVASGATPTVGMITALWAGLFAAVFGGSHFNIVGPTGALSGVIAAFALTYGASGLPMLAIVAGLIVLLAYVLRLERYLILIPSSVIHGFTLGVAFIIGLNQLNFALGLQGLEKHERLFSNVGESLSHLSDVSIVAVILFVVFLAALLLLKKYAPKVPGVVVLSPIGILIGFLSIRGWVPWEVLTLGGMFSDIDFRVFALPSLKFMPEMLSAGAVIALIAILETMLSAKIADVQTGTKHNERKEMLGLGLANLASGLLGGMPATAALARTSLNVKTGATHRTSGILAMGVMALVCAFLFGYFQYIPMPVIASILVYVAIKMVEREHFVKLWETQKQGFWVSLLVAAFTVFMDPMIGILLGVSVSLLLFVQKMSLGHFECKANKYELGVVAESSGHKVGDQSADADVLVYSFKGKICYVDSRAHVKRFEHNFANFHTIVLRMREAFYIDTDGAEAFEEIIKILEERGQTVLVTGVDKVVEPVLVKLSPHYKSLKENGEVFAKTEDALVFAGVLKRANA